MNRYRIGVAGLAIACGLLVAVPAAADVIGGTPENDTLVGTGQNDEIRGKGGDDKLRGRGRIDMLDGGPGADNIQGGTGFDEISGGRGDDKIRAREGNRDQIDCGPGTDTAVVDRIEDGIFDCETIRVGDPE